MGLVLTAQLYQFAANKKAALEDSGEIHGQLPELSLELVEQFFNRLSPEDKAMVLRHKVLPVASLPHITLYGAAGDYAAAYAAQSGLRIIAGIDPQDLRSTIRRKLGPELLRKATHHLRLRRPEYSAFTRITFTPI